MHDENHIELIDKFIDGRISDDELERLNTLAERDPEFRKLFNDSVGISKLFDKVKDVEPPSTLKHDILSLLPAAGHTHRGKNLFQRLGDIFIFKPKASFAYGLFCGALIGVVGIFLLVDSFNDTTLDKSQLTGTFLTNKFSTSLKVADQSEIDIDGVRGIIDTKYADSIILIELAINSEKDIDLIMEFDGNRMSLAGFERNDYGRNIFDIEKNSLKLHHLGRNSYRFIFIDKSASPSQLEFKIFSNRLLYEKTLNTRHVSR